MGFVLLQTYAWRVSVVYIFGHAVCLQVSLLCPCPRPCPGPLNSKNAGLYGIVRFSRGRVVHSIKVLDAIKAFQRIAHAWLTKALDKASRQGDNSFSGVTVPAPESRRKAHAESAARVTDSRRPFYPTGPTTRSRRSRRAGLQRRHRSRVHSMAVTLNC